MGNYLAPHAVSNPRRTLLVRQVLPYTAGSGLLSLLGIDASFLVLTGMAVSGITNSRVEVLEAIFLEISSNGRDVQPSPW